MAELDFIVDEMAAVGPDGSRFTVVIRVGRPTPDDGPHVCAFHVEGLQSKPRWIGGEGAMQAMHLALEMVKLELEMAEARGIRFYDIEEDQSLSAEPFDWHRCWYRPLNTTGRD